MDASSHDVRLGGRAAGLCPAIPASEVHPKVSIAVISKVDLMPGHALSAEGRAASVTQSLNWLRPAEPQHRFPSSTRREFCGFCAGQVRHKIIEAVP
jgi:hypothetical protein